MATLTKEQVRNLLPEHQEDFAKAEFLSISSRMNLLEEARRGMSRSAELWMGFAGLLAIVSAAMKIPLALPIIVIALTGFVTFQVTRIHRRLDAVVELIEADRKSR